VITASSVMVAAIFLIKNKPPNNSHRQLVEVIGVPKLAIVRYTTAR
jgi:hypothetical protein